MTRTRRVLAALIIGATSIATTGSVLPGRAWAADSLSACFTLGGRAVPVSLASLEATNADGNWVSVGSVTLTQANGCVKYNLWGTFTRYNLRVVMAGVTPDGTGLVLGVSHLYAPGAYRGNYNLGRWETTVVRGKPASSWLDWMDSGASTGPSPASMVAAFSDRLGPSFSGNVLCPHSSPADSDCDGVPDSLDANPYDFRFP